MSIDYMYNADVFNYITKEFMGSISLNDKQLNNLNEELLYCYNQWEYLMKNDTDEVISCVYIIVDYEELDDLKFNIYVMYSHDEVLQ